MKLLPILVLILSMSGCTLIKLVNDAPGRNIGNKVDNACLLGKLSQEQIDAINSLPWSGGSESIDWDSDDEDKLQGYNDDMYPRKAEMGDRILTHECANAIREAFSQEPKR